MDFWNHRSAQDKCDLADLKAGTVRDDETPPEEMDRTRLSPRQMLALRAFHSGSSITDAAKAAGVTRQTLHRWRTVYHWFSEAMEVWEEGQMIIARSRLVDMADNAIDALAHAIEDGNARAAMLVLKSLRILRTYAPLKPPAEKMPSAAREQWNSRAVEQEKEAGDTGWKPVVREQEKEAGAGPAPFPSTASENVGKAAASAGVAPKQRAPEKIAPVTAQQSKKTSDRPAEKPKTAILTGKAGSAIKKACDIALQGVTGFDEMLHAIAGPSPVLRAGS